MSTVKSKWHERASRIMPATLRAMKKMLALSVAVSTDVLEQRDPHGRYVYARGRHKYYGIGALVIFFALFSGYGMAHMLATMSNVSAQGAIVAGVLWAMFQWCLERQIIMSIAHEAAWYAKAYGFFWRALLAILSASTMIYPFFVECATRPCDALGGEGTIAVVGPTRGIRASGRTVAHEHENHDGGTPDAER